VTLPSADQGLHCTVTGTGPAVVLLHGFLENGSMWSSLATSLENDFTIIRIDLPGHGTSALLEEPQSMKSMARAVASLLQSLNIDRFAAIGHSMGGYVALELAQMHPENVAALSLFHSNPFADAEAKKKDRAKAARVAQRNLSVFVEAAIPNLFTPKNQRKLAQEIDALIADAIDMDGKSVAACLLGMRDRSDFTDWILSTDLPLLLIAGKEDAIMPYKELEKLFPKSPTIEGLVLEKVAHMGHLEAPEECSSIYKKWLETVFRKSI